jgi:hypothetical protein
LMFLVDYGFVETYRCPTVGMCTAITSDISHVRLKG